MRSTGGVAPILCALALGLGALLAGPASAAGPGVIDGQLVNASAGGSPPAGAEVVLRVFQGESHERDVPARADERGGFRFAGLDVGDGYAYEVAAVYQGIVYGSEPILLAADVPERRIELAVYEPTGADPGLRAARVLLVVGPADAERQELAVSELATLANPSDRVFAPGTGGVGPMGLLRFGLPAGARGLQVSLGLDPAQVIQVDRGFGSTTPVPPGEREFGYSYALPYAAGRAVVEKSLPYGAALLRIVAPADGPRVTGPALGPEEPLEIDGRRYHLWTVRDLEPGARLIFEIDGLPAQPLASVVLGAATQPAVAPAALGLCLLAGAYLALRRPRPSRAPARMEDGPTDSLVDALAALDDAFAEGRIAEPAYRERRAELKARLRSAVQEGALAPIAGGEEVSGG